MIQPNASTGHGAESTLFKHFGQLVRDARSDAGSVKTPRVGDQDQHPVLQGRDRSMLELLRVEVHCGKVGQHGGGMAG